MVIHFFLQNLFLHKERGKPPTVIFQLDVKHQLPIKLPQKSFDGKPLLFSIQACSKSSEVI
jgi:hypothetical protein